MAQAAQFVISEFTNPSGEIVFRVTGWLDGKRIRKNFPTRAEASAERQALEIQRLQAETGIRTTATRLNDAQLHEAEAAFRRLVDAPKSLSFYLDFALANYRAPDREQSKLGWIREQQAKLRGQAREAPRQFVERESHEVWGRRRLLNIKYRDAKPSVALDHKRITLTVRPGSTAERRSELIHEWHKALLHEVACEQGEREERDEAAAVDLFDVVHELLGLLGAERGGGTATVGDTVMGDFFDRIGGDPVLLKREFEEGVENAAAVVDGLRAGVAALAMGGELLGGQL